MCCGVCRETERAESEARLERELERLRRQAKEELENVTAHTRELYERENRRAFVFVSV